MHLNINKIKIFNWGISTFGLLIQDHPNYHKMREGLRWWSKKWGRGGIGVVHCVCTMCIYFFHILLWNFLKQERLNSTSYIWWKSSICNKQHILTPGWTVPSIKVEKIMFSIQTTYCSEIHNLFCNNLKMHILHNIWQIWKHKPSCGANLLHIYLCYYCKSPHIH